MLRFQIGTKNGFKHGGHNPPMSFNTIRSQVPIKDIVLQNGNGDKGHLVLFVNATVGVAAGEAEVDEPHLVLGLALGAVAEQQVGALDVGVHVLLVVDVLEHVDDAQRQVHHRLHRQPFAVGLEQLLHVRSETLSRKKV